MVQHLDPRHESALSEILDKSTDMPVRQAVDGERVQPDTIYVIKPDTTLAVVDGRIRATQPRQRARRPVDDLFRSLADDPDRRCAGVVLSGAGSDGTDGLRALRAAGGLTLAQEPDDAQHPSMPQSAAALGVVDLILPISAMADALVRFHELDPSLVVAEEDDSDASEPPPVASASPPLPTSEELGRLAAILESQTEFDIRVYKDGTIQRRVLRRMVLAGFDVVGDYLRVLRDDVEERGRLTRDLLISVTEFFRDPAVFALIDQHVVLPLVEDAQPGETLRVWVPGCATGEEPYSLGMLFLEAIDASGKDLDLQIFATDLDSGALEFARTGLYPPSIEDAVGARRLDAWFRPADGVGWQVRPRLRDCMSFAHHDICNDPPFSRMHLVSCRNLLIYLTPKAQSHALRVSHFALRTDGYLLLGTSESTGAEKELFSTVSREARLYQKVGISQPMVVPRSSRRRLEEGLARADQDRARREEPSRRGTDRARQAILEARVPPTLVITGDGAVVHMHGELRPFLRFPQGDSPRLTLSELIVPELATRVRAVVYKARRDEETVSAISSFDDTRKRQVRVVASPAEGLGDGSVILTFESLEKPEPDSPPGEPAQEAVIAQLEKELLATREDLRSTVEELETSNEELRSSNEESMSMNEELQSANEELEATTEELRSLNEELTTVNAQLRDKVEQLEQAHDDLANFFASTKIATVFLDDRLRIKRYTPAAAELLSLERSDVGRHIDSIGSKLLGLDLEQEVRGVLESFRPLQHDVTPDGGATWVSRRVLPYRTESRRIEGAVVTFVDITEERASKERLRAGEQRQAVIARLGLHGLRDGGLQSFLNQAVREVQQTLRTDYCKVLELLPDSDELLLRAGVGWREGLVGEAQVGGGLESQAGYTLRSGAPVVVEDLATDRRFQGPPLLAEHGVTSGMSCTIGEDAAPLGVIGVHTRDERTFTQDDVYFLESVAAVIGSVIARSQSAMRAALERNLTVRLAQATTVETAAQSLFEGFSEEMGVQVAELWWADDAGRLSCRSMHAAEPAMAARAREVLNHRIIEAGHGLVGTVYQTRSARWLPDLDSEHFDRRAEAREMGLVSGFGVPLITRKGCLGTLTFYSPSRMVGGRSFLRSLESLGRWIGEALDRLEVEAQVRHLAAITRSSQDAILSWSRDGLIDSWLGGAEELYGWRAEEVRGTAVHRLVPPERQREFELVDRRIRRGEQVPPLETRRLHKEGDLIDVEIRLSAVRDADGDVIAIASTDRNITRRKETEAELVEADRQKDEFLAMLAHELRNPLAVIRTAAELLTVREGGDARLQRAHGILVRQIRHMAKLLDGLLDISRIVRNKIQLDWEVLDLGAEVFELVAEVRDRTALEVELHTQVPDTPTWVRGDRVRIRQIIDNLVTNAIKYTEAGGRVDVTLSVSDELATLSVDDTGVGIAPELLPHVFDVFRQADRSLDRSQGGLGLGLALVRSLVELHGGRVAAHSDGVGEGASFRVRLPVLEAPQTRSPSPTETEEDLDGPPGLEIVLIEDNHDLAEMLVAALENEGHRVRHAGDGEGGLELIEAHLPGLVLCDLGLPGAYSGYQVAERLRGRYPRASLPLVAISGYGRPEDRTRSREAGFDAHLTKPLDLGSLPRVLVAVTEERGFDVALTPSADDE